MINVVDTFETVELLCKSRETEELTRHIIHVTDRLLRADSDLNHLDITHQLAGEFPSLPVEVLNEFVVGRAICLSKNNCLRHPILRDASLLTTPVMTIHADKPIIFMTGKY